MQFEQQQIGDFRPFDLFTPIYIDILGVVYLNEGQVVYAAYEQQ